MRPPQNSGQIYAYAWGAWPPAPWLRSCAVSVGFRTHFKYVQFHLICCISACYCVKVLSETPGQSAMVPLYDINNNPTGNYLIKFLLPGAVALFGLIEFFLTAGLLIVVCAEKPADKVCFTPSLTLLPCFRDAHVSDSLIG